MKNRKTVSEIMLLLLLIGMLTLTFHAQPVEASGTIYIRVDGSIDPPTAPISTVDNVTYIFTGNIGDSIVVERDNIVIDGAGYSIRSAGIGVDLSSRRNVTIKNANIEGFYGGYGGIRLYQSSNIRILGNNITGNSWYGIYLYQSSYNMLKNNHMVDNEVNFGVFGSELSHFLNDIDASNTVDGKPIYYWINKQNMVVPLDAGYVALVNCTGITVKNLHLTKNVQGVLVAYTTNSTITQNNITKNQESFTQGILLWDSWNNTISGNNITAIGDTGLKLYCSSNNRIVSNNITNNGHYGVYLYDSSNNTISGNYITDTYGYTDSKGLVMIESSNNVIYGNIVKNNDYEGIKLVGSSHNIISANDVTDNGEWADDYGIELTYCSIWEGCWPTRYSDNNTIIGNNVTRNTSGIGLCVSFYNNITANNIINNTRGGIILQASGYNILRDNDVYGNQYNFGVSNYWGSGTSSLSTYVQDIDTSNTVNGKPVYYLVNQKDILINSSDIGYLALVNCTKITVNDLSLTNNGQGLLLAFTTNSTIENIAVTHNMIGIDIINSDYNTIIASNINDNEFGISLYRSSSNNITENALVNDGVSIGILIFYPGGTIKTSRTILSEGNIINGNTLSRGGISLSNPGTAHTLVTGNNLTNGGIQLDWYSNTNVLAGNNITNSYRGIELDCSSNNILRNNNMANNHYNFGVRGGSVSDFVNDVDVSNTVDSKPIYYWINRRNIVVPLDAGYVALVNSYNITAKGLQLKNNRQGVLLINTTNSQIINNNITNNLDGIGLLDSSYNTLSGNIITNTNIGIELVYSSNNSIYHNNFLNNKAHIYIEYGGYPNVWDNGYPSGGNYWSDYTGTDLYSGPYQNETGSDGVGDTPYVIDEDNQDNYPLMNPWSHILGDLNKDGKVDMKDVGIALVTYGSFPGHPRWNPVADINLDNTVNIKDLGIICLNYGKTT